MHRNCDFPVRFKTIAVMTCVLLGLSVMPIWGLLAPQRASGQVLVVDHQPHHTGGPSSDTLFLNSMTNQQTWQLLADNFTLATDALLLRVEWWGCYGGFQQNHRPPVGDETMRVRFYDSRPGDGLPGNVVYEESFLNPSRTATGVNVGSCGPEFFYQADFISTVPVPAGKQIWLEIVQDGILNSTFRWEYSLGGELDQAFSNPIVPNWQYVAPPNGPDLAFRLIAVPEPTTLLLVSVAVCITLARPGFYRWRNRTPFRDSTSWSS